MMMKKIPIILLSILFLTACQTTDEISTVVEETDSQAGQIVETVEPALSTYSFADIQYKLDYPSTWSYSEDDELLNQFSDKTRPITQFRNKNGEDTIKISCDFEGGFEAGVKSSQTRSFEKAGSDVTTTYNVFGNNSGVITLGMTEWSEELAPQYYCIIFVQEAAIENESALEIFSSIR